MISFRPTRRLRYESLCQRRLLAANLAPTFTASDPAPVLEDSGPISVAFAAFDSGEATDTPDPPQSVLAYQVTDLSSPDLFASPPTIDTSGTLTFTPAADAFGESTFRVTVQDDGGTETDVDGNVGVDTSPSQTFRIVVSPVNDAPTITLGTASADEDALFQTIPRFVTVFDPGRGEDGSSTAVQTIHDEGFDGTTDPLSTDNTAPTDVSTLAFGSNIVRGYLEPAKSTFNVDVFTFQVEAGFQLDEVLVLEYEYDSPPINNNERNAFLAIDDGPTFPYDVFDLDINENPFFDESAFIGGTVFGLDDLGGMDDDGNVIPGGDILRRAGTITGSRFVAPLPAGTYTFYVQQTGPANRYALDLQVTTTAKQRPVEYVISNLDQPELFQTPPTIDVDGNLRFRAAADANGVATFDVTVRDDGGTLDGGIDTSSAIQGTIQIAAVNDPPTFTLTNPPAIVQAAGPQTVPNFLTNLSVGPSDEADQSIVRYEFDNFTNPEFFNASPSIDAEGTLTYEVRPDLVGSVSFDVTAIDSGDGQNTSASRRVTITVTPPITEATILATMTLAIDGDRFSLVEAGEVILGPRTLPPEGFTLNDASGEAILTMFAIEPSGESEVAGVAVTFASPAEWRMGLAETIAGRLVRSIVRDDETSGFRIDSPAAWQNVVSPGDVDNSGNVSAADALRIINELGRREYSDRETKVVDDPLSLAVWPNVYLDQNGDGTVTALDALRVINELARIRTPSEPEQVFAVRDAVIESWSDDEGDGDDDDENDDDEEEALPVLF